MKYVLALDPGVRTGLALFENSICTIFETIEMDNLGNRLLSIDLPNLVVVVEKLPPLRSGTLGNQLQAVLLKILSRFPNPVEIPPGIWKPVTRSVAIPRTASTPHERDAFRIGMYYLHYYQKDDQ